MLRGKEGSTPVGRFKSFKVIFVSPVLLTSDYLSPRRRKQEEQFDFMLRKDPMGFLTPAVYGGQCPICYLGAGTTLLSVPEGKLVFNAYPAVGDYCPSSFPTSPLTFIQREDSLLLF